MKFSVKLACEFVVKGTEFVIRRRQILVPGADWLRIVPDPAGGCASGVSLIVFWA